MPDQPKTGAGHVSSQATKSHLRPKRQARARLSKVASAQDTIEGFDHGMDVVGLTFGQFSLLDLIDAALRITGPADVAVSTWSAGFYDVEAAARFRDSGQLRSIRFVMDSSAKRGQATVGDVGELFGSENVRATRSHTKFAVLTNDSWSVVITSSMNLNLNPRCEQFEMTDDPDRARLFLGFVDSVFFELAEGDTEDRKMPALAGLATVQPNLGIEIAPRIQTGTVGSMTPDVQAVWDEVLDAYGENSDQIIGPDLEAYCGQVARLREAQRRIHAEGLVIADPKGNPIPHPAVAIEKTAQVEIRIWGRTFS